MSGGGNTGMSSVESIAEAISTVVTLGLGKYDFETGKLQPALWGKAAVTGTKEITGAKAAEEANAAARKRFEEERDKAAQKRKEQQAESAREQVLRSRLAGEAQQPTSPQNNRQSVLGTDEQDYLGI